jgi:hypothetical protein
MKKIICLLALLPFAALGAVVGPDTINAPVANAAAAATQAQGQDQLQGQAQGQLQGQGQSQGNFNAVNVDNDVRNTANSASLSGADSRSTSGAFSGSASLAGSSSEQSQSVSVAEGAVQNSTATSTDQTQTATATNAGNAQSMTYNEAPELATKTVRSGGTLEVRSVPTAIAPNVYPTASCAMSASVGASALGWGVSGGGTKVNEECMMLEGARMFSQLGFASQGLALACSTKSALAVFVTQAACIQYAAGSNAAPVAAAPVATAQPVKVETTLPFGEAK